MGECYLQYDSVTTRKRITLTLCTLVHIHNTHTYLPTYRTIFLQHSYIYVDTCIHIFIHTYVHTTYIHTYINSGECTYLPTHPSTPRPKLIHPFIQRHIHPPTHPSIHPCIHTSSYLALLTCGTNVAEFEVGQEMEYRL